MYKHQATHHHLKKVIRAKEEQCTCIQHSREREKNILPRKAHQIKDHMEIIKKSSIYMLISVKLVNRKNLTKTAKLQIKGYSEE